MELVMDFEQYLIPLEGLLGFRFVAESGYPLVYFRAVLGFLLQLVSPGLLCQFLVESCQMMGSVQVLR
jgi:hypothetical protein